jgi:glycosyltransferase involved in cell wall biosynthesis
VLVTIPWATLAGGAESMLGSILDGAAEGPFEFELVFFEDGPWARELADAGFAVTVLEVGRLRQPHRFIGAVRRLAAIMRARRPALILNWSAKTQLYGSCAALLAGMPSRVMWWQHSIPDGGAVDRLATALPARAILCYSEAAARAQRRLRPARETFPIAAGSAVPAAAGEPAAIELPAGVPVVGIVGRLEPWKGQDRLLRAQALLRARGSELHCLIVGGDAWELSPDYAASLPRLVAELGLEGHVTMTGQVPDAGPYMERMDVLVNASDPEPFGIVLLEGMARGVAVLAVDSGGPSEFIANMQTGVLAPSGEPGALADALETLVGSPELRARLAAAGRESFLRDYTDAAMRERVFARLESQLPAPAAAQPA